VLNSQMMRAQNSVQAEGVVVLESGPAVLLTQEEKHQEGQGDLASQEGCVESQEVALLEGAFQVEDSYQVEACPAGRETCQVVLGEILACQALGVRPEGKAEVLGMHQAATGRAAFPSACLKA